MKEDAQTMIAYVYQKGTIEKRKVKIPEIRDIDVLIKIDKVSVCGSDYHIFRNDDWAKETMSSEIVIGHEGCGTIVKMGKDVTGLSVGDYVALESHYASPEKEKQNKTADDDPHFGIIGIHGTSSGKDDYQLGGVFAEYIAIPHYCCYKLDQDDKNNFWGSLLEPAGNSFEIMRYLEANHKIPDTLAIFGCGPHSLNMQLFAKIKGVKTIVAFETDPFRREFAKKFNMADYIFDPAVISDMELKRVINTGFDLAIDMVGNIQVVDRCKEIVKDNGMIILFGLPKHEALVAHGENFAQIIFNNEEHKIKYSDKSIILRGFTGRSQACWEELLDLLSIKTDIKKKLEEPLTIFGDLNSLEDFIKEQPENFLKAGFKVL